MQDENATVILLSEAEKKKWIDRLPNIAGRWAESAENRGHSARKTLTTYMDSFRARGGQPLRNWDLEN